jgi:SAM-dependent methyltransferase
MMPAVPETDRVASHYQGEAGQAYHEYQRWAWTMFRLEEWKFRGHIKPSDVVLDFGCGEGGLLANLPAAERLGVEVNPEASDVAASRGLRMYRSTDEVDEDSVDVVISHHALEHTLSPYAELASLRRVLRPSGRLLLWLPIDDWRGQRAPDSQDPNHHLYTWTPLLLGNLLREAGFTVVECRVVTHAWPPLPQLAIRLPEPAFHAVARLTSMRKRHRQIMALATA